MKNLPEFKKLIERYETITIEEIGNEDRNKELLTGFGCNTTCTLCLSAGYRRDKFTECKNCVYYAINKKILVEGLPCNNLRNKKTCDAISDAETSDEILTAYRNRAKHMRSILKKLNIEF